jgi:uncharacterized protein YbjT (DUF2867 family)
MRILIVGASGYIGSRLARALHERGYELTLMSRDARPMRARFPEASVVSADLLDPDTLPAALEGADAAFYLAHSMRAGDKGFAELDRRAAANFGRAAARAGLSRIVYLGGLGEDGMGLSTHLASRHETGTELAAHGVPITEFRAAVIIGSGGASFEILRHLVERSPVMFAPYWIQTNCQPIGIRDVLAYLVASLDHPDVTGVVEIGGPDVLSYQQMMLTYARERGLRRLILPVSPGWLTPRFSARWVSLVSPVPAAIARPLLEGLRNEVVVRDPGPARMFDVSPAPYRVALRRTLDRIDLHDVESTWFDSFNPPDRESFTSLSSLDGMLLERRQLTFALPPGRVFAEVERIGGKRGWPYANVLWRIRGLMDRGVGGVGMRLGRRSPDELRVGDALDFWRVEEIRRPRILRLRAEMRVPGRAWLQYEVEHVDDGCRLIQTAFFEPKGLPGLLYWYALYPIHGLIFRGMVRRLGEQAARAQEARPIGV